MRLVQPFRKLSTNKLLGLNPTTLVYDTVLTTALFESDQRWISERVAFNARRVLLTEDPIPDPYRVLKVGDDDIEHILYSEQRAVHRNEAFLYDYTVMDVTNTVDLIQFDETASASGVGGSVVETVVGSYPIHLVRFGGASSEMAEHVDFSRSFAFGPSYMPATTDMELDFAGERYSIEEVEPELLAIRMGVIKR